MKKLINEWEAVEKKNKIIASQIKRIKDLEGANEATFKGVEVNR